MSTLSSPRPSIASSRAHSPTPASSRRPSVDTLNTGTPTTRAVSPSLRTHRNRTALRDYYNLKPGSSPVSGSGAAAGRSRSIPRTTDAGDLSSPSVLTAAAAAAGTELDNPEFDAEGYVSQLLATSSLSTVLKAENTLVGDIRTLDGERKALVYDNYSKLIRAVETIGKMRRSMDERGTPLTMTKTLGPAISFVAETAGSLIRQGEEQRRRMKEAKVSQSSAEQGAADRETVRWVLATPARLRTLIAEGRREDAERDWTEIRALLDGWPGVGGVTELHDECMRIMDSKFDSV
ncbi:hypothetical protein ASPZODRAFT_61732 [Penicilliopsis zonata CBS 506.65]|uniref:Vacuolar protein sorting-associated protein 51 homolog n=1 Tax=Penicilliopsis zonata CBS 506.65 TaxID=1073090 RepID=A0A1L9SMZ1_9EURO|nr:hypothetical protein ASPZODRAFT_61732 [Penicilliopsis zonata CBS 506.65]OJJ48632.1 hypothetical protein ASPZODRAFT_61732 [Penicilliopsis zonata CBS 506.65]